MQYKAYLLAACLAAGLPMQACSQDVTRKGSEDMMQEISNSRNMQVWDRLMAEEAQRMSDSERIEAQKFNREAKPLNQIFQIPKAGIHSIELYVINKITRYDTPIANPENIVTEVRMAPGSAEKSNRDDHLGAFSAYYFINKSRLNNIIYFIDKINVRFRNIEGGSDLHGYDYRMVIKIKYDSGHVIYISSDRRYWYLNYVNGTIIGLTDKPVHVQYNFRDLNILFQAVDPNMIIFAPGNEFNDFYRKWENERDI